MSTLKKSCTSWILLTCLISILSSPRGNANEMVRPQSLDELKIEQENLHYRVPGASVAWADYDRIRADFPALKNAPEEEIRQWILDQFAYISEAQLRLRNIRSTDFEVVAEKIRKFSHPKTYNRAALAPARYHEQEIGLVDLKGTGHRRQDRVDSQVIQHQNAIDPKLSPEQRAKEINQLRIKDHSDGLMSLGEAIAETSRQKAIQKTFDLHNAKSGTSLQTVENYFVIDLGFDLLKEDGLTIPAGIVGRQAHVRGSSQLPIPREIYVDTHGGMQSSMLDSSVDFGGVTVTDARLQKTFGVPVPEKDDSGQNKVAFDGGPKYDPQKSNAWKYGHDTAIAYREHVKADPNAARRLIEDHFTTMLEPLENDLKKLPHPDPREEYIRYIVQRLDTRDPFFQERMTRRFLDLEIREITPRLKQVFKNENPDTVVAPILSTLLTDGRIALDSPEYRRLLLLSQRYSFNPAKQGKAVTLRGLEELRSSKDRRALAYLTRALMHPEKSVRLFAQELFLERDLSQTLPIIEKILEIDDYYPRTISATMIPALFKKAELKHDHPAYKSLVRTLFDRDHELSKAILVPALEHLAQDADPGTLPYLQKSLKSASAEVRDAAVEALFKRNPGLLSTEIDALFKGSEPFPSRLIEKGLFQEGFKKNSPEYQRIFTKALEATHDGQGDQEVIAGLLKIVADRDAPASTRYILGTLKAQSDLIQPAALKIIRSWPFEKQLEALPFFLAETAPEFTLSPFLRGLLQNPQLEKNPRIFERLVAESFADSSIRGAWRKLAVLDAMKKMNRPVSPERLLAAAADGHLPLLRRQAAKELARGDLKKIESRIQDILHLDHPASTLLPFAEELLSRSEYSSGQPRRYAFLEKFLAAPIPPSAAHETLSPILKNVVDKDPDPRVLPFILGGIRSVDGNVRKAAMNSLLNREVPQILSRLPELLELKRPIGLTHPLLENLLLEKRIAPLSPEWDQVFKTVMAHPSGDDSESYVIWDLMKAMASDSRPETLHYLIPGLQSTDYDVWQTALKALKIRPVEHKLRALNEVLKKNPLPLRAKPLFEDILLSKELRPEDPRYATVYELAFHFPQDTQNEVAKAAFDSAGKKLETLVKEKPGDTGILALKKLLAGDLESPSSLEASPCWLRFQSLIQGRP